MAFPQVAEIIATDAGVFGASIDVDLGSSIAAGDLLLVGVVQADTADAFDALSGWTNLIDGTVFASGRYGWWKRKATGAEGGSVTVGMTAAGSVQASGLFIRIAAGSWSGDLNDVELGGSATNAGTNASPGSMSPSWGSDDNLWIAVCGCDDDDAGLSAYPSGYSNGTLAMNTGGTSQQCRIACATLESAASSEDAGDFVLPASEQWAAATIAVRPSAWSLVGESAFTVGSGAGTESKTLPGSPAEGDVVIVMLAADNATLTLSTSGYTGIGGFGVGFGSGNQPGALLAYKVMGASPDTAVVINQHAGANVQAGLVQVWRGCDPTTPLSGTPGYNEDATAPIGDADSPSITTVTDRALVFTTMLLDNDDVASSVPVPSGYSNMLASDTGQASTTVGSTVAIASMQQASAGAEDPPAWTGMSSDAWGAVTFALRLLAVAGGAVAPIAMTYRWRRAG
jgi:hypothetical protein